MRYKDYVATYEYDKEFKIYHGRILGIRAIIIFEGKTLKALKQAFKEAVEFYLDTCQEENRAPEKSYSGELRIKITPEMHLNLEKEAEYKGMSLDAYLQFLVNNRKNDGLVQEIVKNR